MSETGAIDPREHTPQAPSTGLKTARADLRVAGVLSLPFPAALILLGSVGILGDNDSSPLLSTLASVGIWGLVLGGISGFIGMFFAIFSGDDLPDPWGTVRALLILAAVAEVLAPVSAVVAFLTFLSNFHG